MFNSIDRCVNAYAQTLKRKMAQYSDMEKDKWKFGLWNSRSCVVQIKTTETFSFNYLKTFCVILEPGGLKTRGSSMSNMQNLEFMWHRMELSLLTLVKSHTGKMTVAVIALVLFASHTSKPINFLPSSLMLLGRNRWFPNGCPLENELLPLLAG